MKSNKEEWNEGEPMSKEFALGVVLTQPHLFRFFHYFSNIFWENRM